MILSDLNTKSVVKHSLDHQVEVKT